MAHRPAQQDVPAEVAPPRGFGLDYLHTHLAFTVDDVDVGPEIAFFESHFTRGALEERPTATLAIRRRELRCPPDDAVPAFIRRSRTEFFTVRARQTGGPDRPGLVCESSGSSITFTPGRHHVQLDVPGRRPGLELIELVRNTVLGNEENHGVVMLHAAVVELDGRAVVIVGHKGAGKTSSALELILHHGGRMLSGDKALLLPGGDTVRVAGWPDWPHVGLGTLTRFPRLLDRFGLGPSAEQAWTDGDPWSMRHKVPLDPATYAEVVDFCTPGTVLPVAAVLYPCLGSDTPEVLTPCSHDQERPGRHVESSFDSGTAGWNPLVAPSPRLPRYVVDAVGRVAALPAFELSGSGAMRAADAHRLACA